MNILHLLHVLFLGFFDPPPAQRKHVFSTENKQKLAFSDPLKWLRNIWMAPSQALPHGEVIEAFLCRAFWVDVD